jgi:NADH-quinone oxidoreductase subunit G
MRSASRTYFGRFNDGVLESPFSGNLSDICPTGVYTDKPSRFFGRRWDYVRSPSLCIHCSLGCHTIASSRYREVKRQEARYSQSVNGHFICDRGRYGFFYSSLPGRPRAAKIGETPHNFTHAQSELGEKLKEIGDDAGSSAIAAACSVRSNLETRTALSHLCRINKWQRPAFFSDPATGRKAKAVAARLEPQLRVSLREVEKADFVFIVGADPVNEAPMLTLALRQAQRAGAAVFVLDPRPISLPFAFRHLTVLPGALNRHVGQLIQRAVDHSAAASLEDKAAQYLEELPGTGSLSDSELQFADEALQHLQQSKRPVFVCGTQIAGESTIGVAADFALLLQASDKQAGVFYVLPGANAFAGDMLDTEDSSLLQIIEEIENGSIKALILVETNPYWCFPDRQRLDNALDKLDLLVVLDYLPSRAVRKAHVFLPTQTLYESGGLYANQEGRVQYAPAVFSGGKPIAQAGGGDHPPRVYNTGLPESDLQPAWLTLAQLADENLAADTPKARETIRELLADSFPEIRKYDSFDQLPEDGFHLNGTAKPELRFSLDWIHDVEENQDPDDEFELLLTDWTFGTEELSSLSPCLVELEPEPCLVMHLRDAQQLGLGAGDFVEIKTGLGSLQVMVALDHNIAPGVLCLPRHPRLPWQIFRDMKIKIKRDQIKNRGIME